MKDTSNSGVFLPVSAGDSKKVAGPCELTALKLTAGNGAAAAWVYDGVDINDAKPANLRWVLDASVSDVDGQDFNSPLIFKKGVFIILDQGSVGGQAICYATRNYIATP